MLLKVFIFYILCGLVTFIITCVRDRYVPSYDNKRFIRATWKNRIKCKETYIELIICLIFGFFGLSVIIADYLYNVIIDIWYSLDVQMWWLDIKEKFKINKTK